MWLRADVPAAQLRAAVAPVPGVRETAEADGRLRVSVDDEGTLRRVSQAVTARGWTILELSRDALTLEAIFLRLIHDESAPEPSPRPGGPAPGAPP